MKVPLLNAAGVAILLATWFAAVPAQATTVVPPTFEEMTVRADLIFVGTATSTYSEWRTNGPNRAIFTLTTFQTQDVLKGDKTPFVTLQFLGGTLGDVTLEVAGVPRFNAGERVILFVEKNGSQFCPLVGVFNGKFTIKTDETTGRDFVVMHDGHTLKDVAEIGSGEGAELGPKRPIVLVGKDRDPMTLEGFKSAIRDNLAKARQTK
jgi:hypothetical protein